MKTLRVQKGEANQQQLSDYGFIAINVTQNFDIS